MTAVSTIFDSPVEFAPADISMRRTLAVYPCAFIMLAGGCIYAHFMRFGFGHFHHGFALAAKERDVIGVVYSYLYVHKLLPVV